MSDVVTYISVVVPVGLTILSCIAACLRLWCKKKKMPKKEDHKKKEHVPQHSEKKSVQIIMEIQEESEVEKRNKSLSSNKPPNIIEPPKILEIL